MDDQQTSDEVWEIHLQESMDEVKQVRELLSEIQMERSLVTVLNREVDYLKAKMVLLDNELDYYKEASMFAGP